MKRIIDEKLKIKMFINLGCRRDGVEYNWGYFCL